MPSILPNSRWLGITSMADWDDVRRIALALPEATEEPLHGLVSWRVRGKLFAWERPLRKTDLHALGYAAPQRTAKDTVASVASTCS